MQSGDRHECTNASDILVYPVQEPNSDMSGNVGGLGNVAMGQPGTLSGSPQCRNKQRPKSRFPLLA